MYTVLVADDETELRRSLIERTPWEECGFRVVGEAGNGMDALEQVERLEPDLLLTDIRMPFLSGIALARAVREIRPAMHIAFLSGYDDFTYAQQAIQYNIISYMLKPISSEELRRELCAIREKIDRRYQEIAHGSGERLHRSDFLLPLLLGATYAETGDALEAQLREQAAECGLLPQEGDVCFSVLSVVVQDESGASITTRAHVHVVELVLQKYLSCACCFAGSRVAALAVGREGELSKYLHIAVSEIGQSIERAIGAHCTVGVSRPVSSLAACRAAYLESLDALAYTAESEAHFIADLEPSCTIRSDYSELATQLENHIKGGSHAQLEAFFEQLLDVLKHDRLSALETDLMMVQMLAAVCRAIGAVVDQNAASELWGASSLYDLFFSRRSPEELRQTLSAFCLRVSDAIANQCRESSELLCERALGEIDMQYGDEALSLVSLSEKLHISPNYLSALIRKTTGETFINLLTAKRLDTARELLLCTPLKVMEIAAKCGYSDQHYFSYCFKKRFGVSPITLRRQGAEGGAAP